MPEILATPPQSAEELRSLVQTEVGHLDPAWRVIAKDILGLDGRIDLVALDGRGRVVVILLGLLGEDDRALLTRLVAQRSWVAPRVGDWAQLAPELELDPAAPVRGVLMAPDFAGETRTAAESLDTLPVELIRYTSLRTGARQQVLLSPLEPGSFEAFPRETREQISRRPKPPEPVFRSGLSDQDLGLSQTEAALFDDVEDAASRDRAR
ncbi:MAG: hypothetical protein VCC04_13750 [Myxococcota bacterium]